MNPFFAMLMQQVPGMQAMIQKVMGAQGGQGGPPLDIRPPAMGGPAAPPTAAPNPLASAAPAPSYAPNAPGFAGAQKQWAAGVQPKPGTMSPVVAQRGKAPPLPQAPSAQLAPLPNGQQDADPGPQPLPENPMMGPAMRAMQARRQVATQRVMEGGGNLGG
jgi:hypothetical protein